MSTPQANDRLAPAAFSPRNPGEAAGSVTSQTSREPSSDVCGEDKTPPGSDTDSEGKKASPSDSKFLDHIRSFNVSRSSSYRHYGHQSLMNAQSLSQIIDKQIIDKQSVDGVGDRSIDKTIHKSVDKSAENPIKKETKESQKAWEASSRVIVDEKIAEMLGIPLGAMEKDGLWPYSSETLREILRLKTEQEKSKQESHKIEFGLVAIELLRLAESLHISGDLIPFLFISSTSADELRSKVHNLQADPKVMIDQMTKGACQVVAHEYHHDHINSHNSHNNHNSHNIQNNYDKGPGKRRHSETRLLPSFSETTENIRAANGGVISPNRSPEKLPLGANSRSRSGSSEGGGGVPVGIGADGPGGAAATAAAVAAALDRDKESPRSVSGHSSAAPHSVGQYLHQHLPQQQPQPSSYQVCYPPGSNTLPAPQPGQKGMESPSARGATVLGSPYLQKYPAVMYPPHQGFQVSGSTQMAQQAPYHYYIGSSPTHQPPPVAPQQYYLHPSGQHPSMLQQYVSKPQQVQYQSPESENGKSVGGKSHRSEEEAGSYGHNKRQKHSSGSKSSGINFMITTPKNPPARKYNNKDR